MTMLESWIYDRLEATALIYILPCVKKEALYSIIVVVVDRYWRLSDHREKVLVCRVALKEIGS